ncbi:hypothetical protein DVP10_19210, partial [Yersinia enterocolitica]|nr:hypothetical protein [Yersinia enterocolitica]EKN5146719.1 hypothetical protein [Yersinia enterocolitica]
PALLQQNQKEPGVIWMTLWSRLKFEIHLNLYMLQNIIRTTSNLRHIQHYQPYHLPAVIVTNDNHPIPC